MGLVGIIAISVAGACLVIGALLILYFTVFQHMKLKNSVKNFQTRFEKSHAMLFGQDSQYIKRLETISSMNLTYVEDYSEWSRKFKDIRDVLDANAQASINGMQDLLSERKYSVLKEEMPNFKKNIDDYVKAVFDLDRSLRNKFQDEETCRQIVCEQRDRFRKVKQEYYVKQADLTLVSSSFEAIFRKIDMLLVNVDTNIENAQYIDAKTILTNDIAPVTDSLEKILKNLPSICVNVTTVLPEKVMRLSHRYEEMSSNGYPLYQILVKADISALDEKLSSIAQRIQGLDLKGVEASLDSIARQIDEYMEKFDEEVAARKSFEEDCGKTVKEETFLESTYINICHALPALKSIYLLDEEEQMQVNAIQDAINKTSASKRTLDTYVNSVPPQPYTVLLEKLNHLRSKNDEASKAIKILENCLASLKSDSEEAKKDLSSYYGELRKAEITVRKMNVPSVSSHFENDFALLHQTVDSLQSVLFATPIDVKKVRELHLALKTNGDKTFASVTKVHSDLMIAEKEIVKVNRKRNTNSQINAFLAQAEGLFLSGDFRQAYETTLNAERILKDFDE